jgi:cobyrinic acid a,c-diamide synthase
MDGIVHKNVFAAYTHLHVAGAPMWADAFVSLARAQRAGRSSASTLVT